MKFTHVHLLLSHVVVVATFSVTITTSSNSQVASYTMNKLCEQGVATICYNYYTVYHGVTRYCIMICMPYMTHLASSF